MKRQITHWGKIFTTHISDKEFISTIHREPLYINNKKTNNLIKMGKLDFSGVRVVKNPPANAGDTGSIPGPGRSHMLRSN